MTSGPQWSLLKGRLQIYRFSAIISGNPFGSYRGLHSNPIVSGSRGDSPVLLGITGDTMTYVICPGQRVTARKNVPCTATSSSQDTQMSCNLKKNKLSLGLFLFHTLCGPYTAPVLAGRKRPLLKFLPILQKEFLIIRPHRSLFRLQGSSLLQMNRFNVLMINSLDLWS